MKLRFVLVVTLLLAVSVYGVAQGRGNGPGARNYDPKTEMTLTGTVQDVQQVTGPRGNTGTHANLKTEKETVNVHLGPASYLAKLGLTLEKGDTLEVTGSKVTLGGKDLVIAREVKKAGKTYNIRDANGRPAWAGGARQ